MVRLEVRLLLQSSQVKILATPDVSAAGNGPSTQCRDHKMIIAHKLKSAALTLFQSILAITPVWR
jgi:hypothetical protein